MFFKILRVAALPLLFVGVALSACGEQESAPFLAASQPTLRPTLAPAIEPKNDTLFTSAREIRDLHPIPGANGIWAATSGGVLQFVSQKWTKWTRRDGLPSNEAVEITDRLHQIVARFPVAIAQRSSAKWTFQSAPAWEKSQKWFIWKQKEVRVSLDSLQWGDRKFALPPQSNGTHISAILNVGPTLLVGIYGDGLWNFDGQNWKRAAPVPANAQEITALAFDGAHQWLGTRREGLFRLKNGKWTQFLQNDEPGNANIQFLTDFGGVLWASTLDDGLIYRSGENWNHVSTPILSSSAPRQLFGWKKRLFTRHGGGIVDSFDGQNWTKNALANIPRKGVYALGGDQNRLYASGWGGWSEWDGQNWNSHYDLAELKGVPILGIWAAQNGETVWLATQSRGVGRWTRKSGELRFFDERDGLQDDWITTLLPLKNEVWAGTFVGGLARFDGEKWTTFPELKGENVTSLAATENGVFAATRRGLWRVSNEGKAQKVGPNWLDEEIQALWAGKMGLWIGARTSLSFWKSE